MSEIRLSRRRFLGATAGGAAALATAGAWAPHAAASGIPKAHISIQMWTIRDMFAADPEGTLRALADIGYVDIELAGIPPGHTATSLRALLDAVGIRAYSGHDGWDPNNFNEASYRAQLERALTLGQRQTGFAWFPGPYTEDYFKIVARQLNRAAAIARGYGLRFFYHNHDFEFTNLRADGRPVYTVLLEETDPSLVKFQMDLMWINFGGGPWRQLLTTMPERFISFHVKDQSPEAAPGCGCDLFADPGPGRRAPRGDARHGGQAGQPALRRRARLPGAPADHRQNRLRVPAQPQHLGAEARRRAGRASAGAIAVAAVAHASGASARSVDGGLPRRRAVVQMAPTRGGSAAGGHDRHRSGRLPSARRRRGPCPDPAEPAGDSRRAARCRRARHPDRRDELLQPLVAWFDDPALAHAIVDVGVQFNNGLEAIYTTAGSPVADVETAFSMSDFTIQPDGLPSTCSASANGR